MLLALDQRVQQPGEIGEMVVDDGPRDAGLPSDRFDRLDDLTKSFQRSRSEDGNANGRNSRWGKDRHVLE